MIAQLAVADGHEVIALDRFGDVDLRAVASGASAGSSDELAQLADGIDADAVVYGGDFENRPDLVARLAEGRELLGTPPERLAAVRDPWAVGAAARAAGARAPETRLDRGRAASHPGAWLCKPRQGGGGRGVRRWAGGRVARGEILQRRIDGLSCSAVAIGDGHRAAVLGLTEQLHRPRGYGWIGNVTPPRLPDSELAELDGQLRAVCAEVEARFGVLGVFGVDAVWDGRHAWVLEVNPRAPASLELFGPGCFEAHLRGALGLDLRSVDPPAATPRVKLVLFAERDVRAPDPGWWPADLVRDIPQPGQTIECGVPLCTLVSADESVSDLADRGARLQSALEQAVLVDA
jgi:predicted ATP-grasp superfamily ATP-dependent carboligase